MEGVVERLVESDDWRQLMDEVVLEVERLIGEGMVPMEIKVSRNRISIVAMPRPATCPACSMRAVEAKLTSRRWAEARCRKCGYVVYYDLWEMARISPTLP